MRKVEITEREAQLIRVAVLDLIGLTQRAVDKYNNINARKEVSDEVLADWQKDIQELFKIHAKLA